MPKICPLTFFLDFDDFKRMIFSEKCLTNIERCDIIIKYRVENAVYYPCPQLVAGEIQKEVC